MKLGTIVRLRDGREATVVSHDLAGYGAIVDYGPLTEKEKEEILSVNPMGFQEPENYQYYPDVLLRDEFPEAKKKGLECCPDFEIVSVP